MDFAPIIYLLPHPVFSSNISFCLWGLKNLQCRSHITDSYLPKNNSSFVAVTAQNFVFKQNPFFSFVLKCGTPGCQLSTDTSPSSSNHKESCEHSVKLSDMVKEHCHRLFLLHVDFQHGNLFKWPRLAQLYLLKTMTRFLSFVYRSWNNQVKKL